MSDRTKVGEAKPGGGKYAAQLDGLMAELDADVVLLVVVGGNQGSGFSIGINDRGIGPDRALAQTPAILRALADSIEEAKGAGVN